MTLHTKMAMPDHTTVPLELLWFRYINVHNLKNWLFLIVFSLKKWQVHFYYRKTIIINPRKTSSYWSDNGFQATVLNWTLPFLHVWSLEFRLTVHLLYLTFRLWAEVFHVTTGGSGSVKWQQVRFKFYKSFIKKIIKL